MSLRGVILSVVTALSAWGILHSAPLPDEAASTRTAIFNKDFSSLLILPADNFMAPPVLESLSDRQLVVSFDQTGREPAELCYRLLHLNADYLPSRLLEAEYVDGINWCPVEDYAYSENTYRHYVNYRIVLPGDGPRPLVSGNYLLQVLPRDCPDSVVLQVRFSWSEQRVVLDGGAGTVTDRGVNGTFQQLAFTLDAKGYRIADPVSELIVTVSQNGDPQTERMLTHPLRMDGDRVVYEHLPELIFEAGNEFRRFETVAAPSPDMGVDSVRHDGRLYNVYLAEDRPRRNGYLYDRTQHGRWLPRRTGASDADIAADYMPVHFTLRSIPLPGDVYVQGVMDHYSLAPEARMEYDYDAGLYRATMLLKQGAYNYRYALLRPGESSADPAPIEGNHYQTRNEYLVKVFHRTPSSRGDRLIGVATFYSY